MLLNSLPRMLDRKTTIYLSRTAGAILFRGKNLILTEPEQREVALDSLRRVVLLGRANIASDMLYRFLRLGIAVDWLDIFGRPLGMLLSLDEDQDRSLGAQALFRAAPGALELARLFLLAKFDNCQYVIRRRAEHEPAWEERRRAIAAAENADSLRGAEGIAAREYFACWKDILHSFQWRGRQPHPAPDPVNMLLSLGYGLLHNRLASALRHAGLNPRLGFFHLNRGRHCALASDLMEPLRAMIDAAVLTLIRKNEIGREHFAMRGQRCVCAGNAVFVKILSHFEEAFARRHKFYHSPASPGESLLCSVNDCLDEVAEGYARHLLTGQPCFVPRLKPWPAT